jgi:hypothetical protein
MTTSFGICLPDLARTKVCGVNLRMYGASTLVWMNDMIYNDWPWNPYSRLGEAWGLQHSKSSINVTYQGRHAEGSPFRPTYRSTGKLNITKSHRVWRWTNPIMGRMHVGDVPVTLAPIDGFYDDFGNLAMEPPLFTDLFVQSDVRLLVDYDRKVCFFEIALH